MRYEQTKTAGDFPTCVLRKMRIPKRLREGQEKLKQKGVDVSQEIIRNHLHAYDVRWRSPVKKSLLSEKRLAWAKENVGRD